MKRLSQVGIASLVFALCSLSVQNSAHAGSGAVGVGITFEVAPASLFRAAAIAPGAVRSCESMSASIKNAWAGRSRVPTLNCSFESAMPLIVTSANGSGLIVRP